MASDKPAWMATLFYDIVSDPYVTGRYGFKVTDLDRDIPDDCLFRSGFVYQSSDDAVQAAEDSCELAWIYRNNEQTAR